MVERLASKFCDDPWAAAARDLQAVFRVTATLLGALFGCAFGIPGAVLGALLGVTVGSIFGAVVYRVFFHRVAKIELLACRRKQSP